MNTPLSKIIDLINNGNFVKAEGEIKKYIMTIHSVLFK